MSASKPESDPGEVTRLLLNLQAGDEAAIDRLFPLVYDELRAAARVALGREQAGHTLQSTELVHEVYFKLLGARDVAWQGRAHFLAVSARAIRQILVDHARRRQAAKRGSGVQHITLGDAGDATDLPVDELLALDDALNRLEAEEPRLRTVVESRFFAGLSEREIAEVLGVTERTVQRDWVRARAWLHKELYLRGTE